MFELHITPKKEFVLEFKEVCAKLNFKIIAHNNLDMYGNILYLEEMLGIKCETMVEVDMYINTLYYYFNIDKVLRVKIESKIEDDFSYIKPYTLGDNYFEVHIDVFSDINEDITEICCNYKCAISKNPNKECFMLTYRIDNLDKYKQDIIDIQEALEIKNIKFTRVIKEYCFSDNNIQVDDPWLLTYHNLKKTYRVMQFIDYQGWQWCDDFDAETKEECEKSIKLLSLEYPDEQFMLINIEEIRENTNRYLGKELEKFLPKGLK